MASSALPSKLVRCLTSGFAFFRRALGISIPPTRFGSFDVLDITDLSSDTKVAKDGKIPATALIRTPDDRRSVLAGSASPAFSIAAVGISLAYGLGVERRADQQFRALAL
ncbi:hypothetical protein NOVOSPHI9U_580007 [Novosphingobium sp. 9U]|nr:hypothetical protein NOVOSPHI9U_580007 [Novosphingobium sp. 9U]